MSTNIPTGETSGLAYYLRHELFHNWQKERKQLLESKWQKNIDAFNSVTTGFWKKDEAKDWRSDTFIALTKIKVLAAYSIILDMLLQGGKIPFNLIPSPWDFVVMDDLPEEERQYIEDAIEDMTGTIHQQLCDCNADRQLMKHIMSGAIYGETLSKWFVQEVERTGFKQTSFAPEGLQDPQGQYNRFESYSTTHNSPAWGYVSVWDIFRDLETDDLQAGQGIIQRQMISPYMLRQKMGQPLYLDSTIQKAIKDAKQPGGPESSQDTPTLPPGLRDIAYRHNTIENLEFWGRVPRKVAKDFEAELETKGDRSFNSEVEVEHDGDEIEIMAALADNEIVRYSRNQPNNRPFDRAVWEIKLDHVEATGVPDNVEDEQKVLVGMIRAYEDNKKLSANVILATKKDMLAPGALDKGIVPGMDIEVADEVDDARKAVQQIIITDVGQSLLDGISLMERYGDEASQIPKLSQGFIPDKKKPDTAYELSQLLTNAGKYIGGVIKNYDEGLLEPNTNRFYKYNMEDPELERGKGNFIAKALGYTSFQNKMLKAQNLEKFFGLLLSSEILTNEGKVSDILAEIAKTLDLEPSQVLKSIEQKKKETEDRQNSPDFQLQQRAMQLELENKHMQNEKIAADIEKIAADIKEMFEELKIERAKVVSDMRRE